jgi:preprotein translocase subunit YajC
MDASFGVIVLATTIAVVFLLVWIVVIVPQNRARKNQERVVEELKIGEQIVTVGGVIGKLTYLNREEDVAKIEVAPGVEIRIIPAAISHPFDYMQRLQRLEREANAPKQPQDAPATAKKK